MVAGSTKERQIRFNNIDDPETLETMAIREALALANDLLFLQIQVASDCKVAVEAIKKGTSAQYGAVIHEIIDRKASFSSCSFVFERRNFNFEAHNLAKFACNLDIGRYIWFGTPHDPNRVPMNIVLNQ